MQTLVEGQSIRHEQYGMGIVTESNHERTTIDFDDHGVKKFVTSIWSPNPTRSTCWRASI